LALPFPLEAWKGCNLSRQDHRDYDAALQKLRAEAMQQQLRAPKFKWQDSLTLVGVALTVVGFVSEDTPVVIGCFAASAFLICWSAYNHKEWKAWRYVIALSVVVLFSLLSFRAYTKSIERELARYSGPLVPAEDPDPPNACSPSGDEVALYLGTNSVVTDNFPLTIIKISGVPTLTLNRNTRGEIEIDMDVLGNDGKVIVRMRGGKFIVNQNNSLSMERKDRSSLLVTDQFGAEVLNARYLNPKAFRLTAKLYSGGKSINLETVPISGVVLV
jgi:hypothetical protein